MKLLATIAIAAIALVAFTSAMKTKPEPVKPFDQAKYLGKWYEIARMDYKWEKNLSNVTATYSLKDNGDIKVDNKGFDYKKKKWEESIGKAKAKDSNTGRLKVSFFGPFYAQYNVIAIDKDYKHALVAGKNKKYLWILSREKILSESVKADFLQKARDAGYNTDELVWVAHDMD